MGLEDIGISESGGDSGVNKAAHLRFQNPEHPDVESDNPEQETKFYNAMDQLKAKSGGNRKELVGTILVAAVRALDGEPETLTEIANKLAE